MGCVWISKGGGLWEGGWIKEGGGLWGGGVD